MPSFNTVRLKAQQAYAQLEPALRQVEKLWLVSSFTLYSSTTSTLSSQLSSPISSPSSPIKLAWTVLLNTRDSRLPLLQHPRIQRLCYRTALAVTIVLILYCLAPSSTSPFSSSSATSNLSHYPPGGQWPYYNPRTHLPHIPPNIWQVQLDFSPAQNAAWDASVLRENANKMFSWVALSPSYTYSLLDTAAANTIISALSSASMLRAHPEFARYAAAYKRLTRGVMRADFLRYLVLAVEGGVYSDTDTELLRPIHEWVPEEYKAQTRLVIGIEGDMDPPPAGHAYQVQFCQWTLASSKGHGAMWAMVERIVEGIESRLGNLSTSATTATTTATAAVVAAAGYSDKEIGSGSMLADLDATRISTRGREQERTRKQTRATDGASGYSHGLSVADIAAEGSKKWQDPAETLREGAKGDEDGEVSLSFDHTSLSSHLDSVHPNSQTEASHKDVIHGDSAEDFFNNEEFQSTFDASFLTDEDVLAITGPRGWTLTIYAALSAAAGSNITWHNLTGMREPRLFGDILVLPIDGFATGIEHSGSTRSGSPDAMVRHAFSGSWRGGWG